MDRNTIKLGSLPPPLALKPAGATPTGGTFYYDYTAPHLSFDGPNVIGTNTKWRFIHAPGMDEPLMARYENYAGAWLRELYFVTDGQGRQLSVGDKKGYIHEGDFSTDGSHWRYSGAGRNATGFDAERLGPGAMPGVSMFRNRAYDSRTGRWTQEDPVGVAGGLNLYQFNGNDPVAYTDPFGLCPKCREEVEGPVTTTDPGLLDPVALLSGGVAGGLRSLGARMLGRATVTAGADAAATSLTGFTTKGAAREALARMGLPEAQAAAANRAIGRATRSTTISITEGEGGSITVNLTRAGRNGKQIMESVISPDGAKKVVQKGIDARGVVTHYDPKN